MTNNKFRKIQIQFSLAFFLFHSHCLLFARTMRVQLIVKQNLFLDTNLCNNRINNLHDNLSLQ